MLKLSLVPRYSLLLGSPFDTLAMVRCAIKSKARVGKTTQAKAQVGKTIPAKARVGNTQAKARVGKTTQAKARVGKTIPAGKTVLRKPADRTEYMKAWRTQRKAAKQQQATDTFATKARPFPVFCKQWFDEHPEAQGNGALALAAAAWRTLSAEEQEVWKEKAHTMAGGGSYHGPRIGIKCSRWRSG